MIGRAVITPKHSPPFAGMSRSLARSRGALRRLQLLSVAVLVACAGTPKNESNSAGGAGSTGAALGGDTNADCADSGGESGQRCNGR